MFQSRPPTRSSPPNTPRLFYYLSPRLYGRDIHFVSYTNLSEFQYLLACRVYLRRGAARVPLSFIFPRPGPSRKSRPTFHDSSVSPSWKVYLQREATLAVGSVSTCPLPGTPRGRVTTRRREKFGRIRTVWYPRSTRESPFLVTLLDQARPHRPLSLSLVLRVPPSFSVPFPSPAPFSSHLGDTLPLEHPLAHPSMLPLAPSRSLFLPCRFHSVRFHPRPSTFRVYRTIARARITVTGRATSWLAVDVGGGRTADRRRRERRRRRRRRRGRAQQIVSETRRATKKRKKKSYVFTQCDQSFSRKRAGCVTTFAE